MEDLKKSQIVNTAIALFQEKGYAAASMQDIAEACGVAKGSVYKYFASKEELFTEAFEAIHRSMFVQAWELDRAERTEELSPKESMRRKIEFQLQYMLEHSYFMFEIKELPIRDNEPFIQAWKRKRETLLTWHRDCILDAYGDSISAYVWDMVAIFRGIVREYLSYALQKVIAIPLSELAAHIAEQLDAVADGMVRSGARPVLASTNVYFNSLNPIDPETRRATVRQLAEAVERTARELPAADGRKQEIAEAAGMLREEIAAEEPHRTLVQVLTAYLDAVPELRSLVRQLKHTMEG